MNRLWVILLLTAAASGQVTIQGGVTTSGGVTFGSPASVAALAQLPQVWANDKECDPPGAYDVTKTIPGDYTAANAQQANVDWAAAADQSWHIVVAHGTVLPPLAMQAKLVGGNMPTKCIVWDSDTPLTANRVVCSHGIQDNLATSTDPGVRNPDCNGSSMSYQLGQTLISIPAGPFTLANGTFTNTSAYNDVASMFIVECNTVNCASITSGPMDANGNGPNHFAFYNAEIRVNSTKTCCWPVEMEPTGSTVASLPSHYHFDRVWLHGDATDSGAGTQSLTDAIRINCSFNCTLSNSQISKIIRPGAEGHGVYWKDGGGIKIVHNWIEGMSINIFDGGIAVAVPGGISGRDIEIRRNRSTYPFPWLGHGSGVSSVCGTSVSCVRKNCFEMKSVIRLLFDGNICENVDNSGGQNGTLTDFNNRACQSPCDNYVATIQDITNTNNIYRHGCGGLLFDALSGRTGGSGNSGSTPGRNFFVQNTLFYDISLINFNCGITNNGSVYLGVASHDFAVTSVTRDAAGLTSHIILTGGTGEQQTGLVSGDPIKLSGCADASFNAGPYPFVYSLTISGVDITYPNVGTPNATTASGCIFNNGAGWPQYVTIDHVTGVGDMAIEMGSNGASANATFPRNLTFTNNIFSGTAGFGAPGGGEGTTFINAFFDTATLLVHHTTFSQRVALTWTINTAYKLGQVIKPPSGPGASRFYTAVTSGTSSGSLPTFTAGARDCVTDNTITWQQNGFSVGTTGGLPNYTEYQVLNTPISPPTTLHFPQTDFTYGATADSTSIGFKGALNAPASGTNSCVSGTQVPGINVAGDLQDWHDYALDTSSTLKGAGTNGSDLGVDVTVIEGAQISTKYVCRSPCGTGPTTD